MDQFLIKWTIRFLENRDSIRKEIVKIENSENGFLVERRDKPVQKFIVEKKLSSDLFSGLKLNEHFCVVTLNNAKNIKFVAEHWNRLAGSNFLKIYFINPFSSMDKVWIINPHIHDKICDKSSLLVGLKSMAESVELTDEFGLEEKIKSKTEESGL
jgi:hypothetical protein